MNLSTYGSFWIDEASFQSRIIFWMCGYAPSFWGYDKVMRFSSMEGWCETIQCINHGGIEGFNNSFSLGSIIEVLFSELRDGHVWIFKNLTYFLGKCWIKLVEKFIVCFFFLIILFLLCESIIILKLIIDFKHVVFYDFRFFLNLFIDLNIFRKKEFIFFLIDFSGINLISPWEF